MQRNEDTPPNARDILFPSDGSRAGRREIDAKETIRVILKRQLRSQRSLALQLGLAPQTLNNRLNSSRDLCIGDYVAMLNALGYELKVVPTPDNRPEFSAEAGEQGPHS